MPNSLSEYETGKAFDGNYAKTIASLQSRLERIQVAHIVHHKPAILVFEGWDAAGKGGIIKRLAADYDPRWFAVHPIAAPTPEEKARIIYGGSGSAGCRLVSAMRILPRRF